MVMTEIGRKFQGISIQHTYYCKIFYESMA